MSLEEQDRREPEERPRAQGAEPGAEDEETAAEDPDRPTDQVWKGNLLREPAPGD